METQKARGAGGERIPPLAVLAVMDRHDHGMARADRHGHGECVLTDRHDHAERTSLAGGSTRAT